MPLPRDFVARDCKLNYLQESLWDPGLLQAKCKQLGLEDEFEAYMIRRWTTYLHVFFILHICVTLIHCVLVLTLSEHIHLIYFDVGVYLVSCMTTLLILSINYCDGLIRRHRWILDVSSTLACITVALSDLLQGLYHHFRHDWQCGSFYDIYIVFMIYMFMPILSIRGASLLAIIISVAYIVYFVTVLSIHEEIDVADISGLSVDILHYLCLNLLGVFFRLINDMVVRSSFLDRHQYIREGLLLRNAQRQEKLLLNSILPPQFAVLLQKDIKNRIILSKRFGSTHIQSFSAFKRSMAIQVHPDVSILYADVVNYTHLTTTLTVEKLVTTLHDLYARFDMAALHYKVQRIKFLGDCYYCVAGLTDPDPDHANNTVSLGVAMIVHIQKVRDAQNLDINMRIGVHSGSLFAGVIGEAKLQYDVWGPDVQIANVLEATGVPGCVHISGTTLNHVTSNRYEIQEGPEKARTDPLLQKHKIETYLIVSYAKDDAQKVSFTGQEMPVSLMNLSAANSANIESENLSAIFKEELHEEYRKMPVSLFDPKILLTKRRKERAEIPLYNQIDLCLTFYDRTLEKAYLKQRDYLFKYHMLLAWLVGNSLVYIQLMLSEHGILCWVTDFFASLTLTALVFIAWYKKLCWTRYNQRNIPHTYGRASCIIFRIHERIQESLTIRIFIYLFVIAVNWIVMISITMTCRYDEFILHYIEERIFHYEDHEQICFHPWIVTDMMALMIGMAFTFTHIPFLLKTVVALLQVITYFILIFMQFDFVFHHSSTTNPFFPAEFAHGFIILITYFTMYLKERQSEFAKKVNFNWRVELEKKENDATMTNRSIIILLNNILPNHVVDIYLNSLTKNELYYENYKMVSVMFAQLSNFQLDLCSLRILNEVITQFDVLLLYYREYYVVEKIKVVNCTYMAACGLDVNFAGSTSKPVRTASLVEEKRLQQTLNEQFDEVVYVMASFALDLMRTLASCNSAYNGIIEERGIIDGTIAIGISSGEIMAGIVGASKPHYDIWGDPVNMASRMQSTGLPGHIQVTEESAKILTDFGIECTYRGQTFVKGRGRIPTYLLAINDDFNFFYTERKRTPTHAERSTVISLGYTYADPE